MDYYKITQRNNVRNYIRPPYMSLTEIWADEKPVFVPGIVDDPKETIAFLPFYETSVFFISGELRRIWTKWHAGGRYRQCAFGSVEQKVAQPYCFMMPQIVDAIHPDSRFDNSGEAEELYLDQGRIGTDKVFGVRSANKISLIVAGDVLEEMLYNDITVLNWKEISVR